VEILSFPSFFVFLVLGFAQFDVEPSWSVVHRRPITHRFVSRRHARFHALRLHEDHHVVRVVLQLVNGLNCLCRSE
jgi:hypothetical protein